MSADPNDIIRDCRSVLLVDWPSPEVPSALVRAGCTVHVKGGPGPQDFSIWEFVDGAPASRRTGRRPANVDLVYVHRPPEELPEIIGMAGELGARSLWYEPGPASLGSSSEARSLAEAAGLLYVDNCDIVEVVRAR
jgi:hypothetical protein